MGKKLLHRAKRQYDEEKHKVRMECTRIILKADWTSCLAKEVDDVLRIFMSRLTTLKYRALDVCNMFFCSPCIMPLLRNCCSWFQFSTGQTSFVLSCGVFPIALLCSGETFRISVNGRVLAACPYPAGSHLGSAFWTLHCGSLPPVCICVAPYLKRST